MSLGEEQNLLLVDKPVGVSSFDVIRWLRRELGVKKMGHAGTLDPFASGLLLVATGSGTKEIMSLIGLDKTYQATVLLGRTTTTLDPEGEVTAEAVVSAGEDDIRQAVRGLVGCHEIPVPLYSAIKVDGKPLYAYARSGKIPPRIPVKTMCVRSAIVQEGIRPIPGGFVEVGLELVVSSGTYIRSLAAYLGELLGVPGMVTVLRRTRIGDFSIGQIA